MNDEDEIISELQLFRAAGGSTVCDVTTIGFRINSEALLRVSEATGVNIVAGTGFYLDSFLSEEHKMLSVREVSPAHVKWVESHVKWVESRDLGGVSCDVGGVSCDVGGVSCNLGGVSCDVGGVSCDLGGVSCDLTEPSPSPDGRRDGG